MSECRQNLDNLRVMLMHEPRGFDGMYGALLVEKDLPEADMAVLFMHNEGRALQSKVQAYQSSFLLHPGSLLRCSRAVSDLGFPPGTSGNARPAQVSLCYIKHRSDVVLSNEAGG